MPIVMRLDRVMADRKVSVNKLAELIGIAPINLSHIKTNKIKAIRFSTLEALCRELRCRPGDLIEYIPDNEIDDFEFLSVFIIGE